MEDIRKINKSFKECDLLIKDVNEAIKNKTKEQTDGFSGMLLGTLGASLLGNMLAGKWCIWAGEGTIKAGQDF